MSQAIASPPKATRYQTPFHLVAQAAPRNTPASTRRHLIPSLGPPPASSLAGACSVSATSLVSDAVPLGGASCSEEHPGEHAPPSDTELGTAAGELACWRMLGQRDQSGIRRRSTWWRKLLRGTPRRARAAI